MEKKEDSVDDEAEEIESKWKKVKERVKESKKKKWRQSSSEE